MQEAEKSKLIIVGGGISGLLSGFFLEQAGVNFVLLEAQPQLGGWVHSEAKDDGLFEWGPHSLLMNADWRGVIEALSLAPVPKRSAVSRRFINFDGDLKSLPLNPMSLLLSPFFSIPERLQISKNLFRRFVIEEEDLSIDEFFRRVLGTKIAEDVVAPFVSGIYAGDARELSVACAFPEVWSQIKSGRSLSGLLFKKRAPSPMVSFSRGLGELIEALRSRLKTKIISSSPVKLLKPSGQGFEVKTDQRLYFSEKIILATPAYEAAALMRSFVPGADYLTEIPYRDVAVLNCLWERPVNFKTGLGFLVPPRLGRDLLGSLWPSEIFEGRCEAGRLITAQFYSGERIPQDPTQDFEFLKRSLGQSRDPLHFEFRVQRQAIPQPPVGHAIRMRRIQENLPGGLFLAGNYLSGVGLTACIREAKQVVTKPLQSFKIKEP